MNLLPAHVSRLSVVLVTIGFLLGWTVPPPAIGATPYIFSAPTLVNDEGATGVLINGLSSGQRGIASCHDSVYTVWTDGRDATFRVYFCKSEDRGASWGPNATVADSGAYAGIAVSPGGRAFVTWVQFTQEAPLSRVLFARSTDGGSSFGPIIEVSASLGDSGWHWDPSVACVGEDTVYVSWHAHLSWADEPISLAKSVDGGLSFGPAVQVTDRPVLDGRPAIAARAGGHVVVAWEDEWDSGPPCGFHDPFCGYRIYLAESNNGGLSFMPSRPATPLYGPAQHPTLSYSPNGMILLAWSGTALRAGTSDIYFSRGPTGGGSYSSPGIVQVDGAPRGIYPQDRPSLTVDDSGQPMAAWRDTRNGDSRIYFARSSNGGSSFDSAVEVTAGSVTADHPSIACTPGGVAQIRWQQDDGYGGSDVFAGRGWPSGTTDIPRVAPQSTIPANERLGRMRVSPNPATWTVAIAWFSPGNDSETHATVYDATGRLVARLPRIVSEADWAQATWDLKDASGAGVPAGVYFVCAHASASFAWARLIVNR